MSGQLVGLPFSTGLDDVNWKGVSGLREKGRFWKLLLIAQKGWQKG
jgi:hypothetical protein